MDKRILGLAIACLMAFSLFAFINADVSAADEEEDPPEPEPITNLHGIVFDIPPDKDRVVIEGVTVRTWTSPDQPFESTQTNAEGQFDIPYNNDVKFISFTMEEFTVKGVCSELRAYGDTGLYELLLPEDPEVVAGTHNLYDADGFTALISRTSASVFGTVTTIINDSEVPVKNAEVSLSNTKSTIRTYTDSDGAFTITVSKGVTYQMTIIANGFVNWTSEVTPSDEPVNVTMQEKDHTVFLGMDLAHTIAIVGLLMIVIVALITVYLGRRPEKVDGIYVVNDLKPREKVEEESRSDEQ